MKADYIDIITTNTKTAVFSKSKSVSYSCIDKKKLSDIMFGGKHRILLLFIVIHNKNIIYELVGRVVTD